MSRPFLVSFSSGEKPDADRKASRFKSRRAVAALVPSLLLPGVFLLAAPNAAQAQTTYNWDGKDVALSGNSNWSSSAGGLRDWNTTSAVNTVPVSAATTTLNFTALDTRANPTSVNDLGTFVLNALTFAVGANPYTISGNDLSFVANGATNSVLTNNSTSLQTINNNLRIADTLTVSGAGNIALGGNLTGAGTLTKAGADTLTLTGTASSLRSLSVNNSGTLTLSSGGKLTLANAAVVDSGTGDNATLNVTGVGSALTANGLFYVGVGGNGALNITNGATFVSASTLVAYSRAGTTCNILVSGAGSSANFGSGLINGGFVRAGGIGTVTINGNATATVTVNGYNGFQNSTLNIGGTGELVGGSLTTSGLADGDGATNSGTINLLDGSAALNVGSSVGNDFTYSGAITGTGTLTKTGSNTQTLTGAASSVGTLYVNGTGTLALTSGGKLTLSKASGVGTAAGANATLNVSGLGSALTANGSFFVGAGGNGALNVTNGATFVSTTTSVVYGSAGVTGSILVSGAGSSANFGSLLVNGSFGNTAGGTGAVTINGGATAAVSGSGYDAYPNSTLNIGGTGALAGGSLTASGLANGSAAPSGTVNLLDGSAALNVGNSVGSDFTYSGAITGAGTLTKTGSNTQTLTGNNTFSGTIEVRNGTLAAGANNALGNGATLNLSAADGVSIVNTGAAGTNNTVGSITFNSGGVNQASITGAGSLTVNGNIAYFPAAANTASPVTITAPLVLTAGNHQLTDTFSSNSNYDMTLAGGISGAGSFEETGNSCFVVLQGTNTYTGGTTLTGGNLYLDTTNTLPTNGLVTVNAGLLYLNPTVAETTNGVTVTPGNYNQTIGSLAGAGGTVSLGSATLTTGTDNTSTTYSGNITGIGGSLVKAGTGSFILAGSNTYTGGTAINNGTITLGATNALPKGGNVDLTAADGASTLNTGAAGTNSTVGNITFNSGGNSRTSITGAGSVTLNGSFTYAPGAVVAGNTTAPTTVNAPLILVAGNHPFELSGNNSNATYDTILAGGITGAGSFEKRGNRYNLALEGVNLYTGGTTVTGGNLYLGATNTLPANGSVTVNAKVLSLNPTVSQTTNGVTVTAGNYDQTIGSLAGAGGTVSLGLASLTTGSDNTSTSYAGQITGVGNLVKTGTGMMTLGGASSVSGTTRISGGTLNITGSLSASNIAVNAGGTLAGTGTVANPAAAQITLGSGAFLSPGDAGVKNSIGTLFAGGLTWQSGGILDFQLGATPASTDLLSMDNGALTKAGSGVYKFDFSGTGIVTPNVAYPLIEFNSTLGTNFATTDFSYINLSNSLVFSFGPVVSGHRTLYATSVPEAGSGLLVLFAGVGLCGGARLLRHRK